jgi:hypothetical protein
VFAVIGSLPAPLGRCVQVVSRLPVGPGFGNDIPGEEAGISLPWKPVLHSEEAPKDVNPGPTFPDN